MSSIIGNKIKVSVFGESHGDAIGVIIDGLPSGHRINFDFVHEEMRRRAPGQDSLSTSRVEKDIPKVLSGIFEERTTGAPLSAIIENNNTKSRDYSELKIKLRPSHCDYPAMIKYEGYNDYRGGGHFSGRLTALLVFAGAICKDILKEYDVYIGAHIKSIGKIKDHGFDKVNIRKELLQELRKDRFPTLNKIISEEMKEEILAVKALGDSIGGVIEGAVINDQYYIEGEDIKTYSNNNGGILGGITSGMPVTFSVAFKPTPSIALPQKTVNMDTKTDDILEIKGRHDPCIVQRAVPVVECVTAIAILDIMLQ